MIIPIFDKDNVKLPLDYDSRITLNNPNDDPKDTFILETSSVNNIWDAVVEPNPDRDGSRSFAPRRVQAVHRITGWVRAPNGARLHDKMNELAEAFDPVLTYVDDPSTFDKGYLPLNFNVPTANLTNFPSGLIPSRIYVASVRVPAGISTKYDSYNAFFDLTLRAVDPVIYSQSTSEVERTGNGTMVANNTLATYLSWPIWEIVFTGAPGSEMTIQRTTPIAPQVIYLDNAQLTGAVTLIIDSQARQAFYSNGTDKIAAVKPASRYFQILPGSNTITLGGFPSDAVITCTWRRAYV